MPDWITHPHASYVLTAYGVAAVMLLGLLLASWRGLHVRQAEWKKLRAQAPDSGRH